MSSYDLSHVFKLAEEVAQGHNLILHDVTLTQRRRRTVLVVTLDRPTAGIPGEGITIQECTAVSHELGEILEAEDLIPMAYDLEVSSPGIERDLVRDRHFQLAIGLEVSVVLQKAIRRQTAIHGILERCTPDTISVRAIPHAHSKVKGRHPKRPPRDQWELYEIPKSSIKKAKTVFPKLPPPS